MTKRIILTVLAVAALTAAPLEAAFARGGGGGNQGGGGSSHGSSERGGFGYDSPQSDSDQKLFDDARRECNGPKYPSGATPRINYDANTFTCFEPGSTRR